MSRDELVKHLVRKHATQSGGKVDGQLERSTKLLDLGLDSLAFIMLTVELEQNLGVDPFGSADEISYPETFGELLDLYREGPAAS